MSWITKLQDRAWLILDFRLEGLNRKSKIQNPSTEHLDLLRLRSVQVARWNRSRTPYETLLYETLRERQAQGIALRERRSKLRVAFRRKVQNLNAYLG
ncbi:MAG: hypothetical protein V7K14_21135 [Nostoc sp.]|uniref:hypothetical protein n=1 Tax=Nostoc sp. TaxID=1180 RepID=UPI002FF73991